MRCKSCYEITSYVYVSTLILVLEMFIFVFVTLVTNMEINVVTQVHGIDFKSLMEISLKEYIVWLRNKKYQKFKV